MAEAGQGRFFHGIILRDFMRAMDIPITKENLEKVKFGLKEYFSVPSTSALSEREYSHFTSACTMIIAREFGVEVPESFAIKTMEQILKENT